MAETDEQKAAKAKADAEAKAAVQPAAAPQPATFTGQVPWEAFRAQQAMSDIEQGRALEMDKTVPGGKYLAEDGKTFVDADGKPLNGDKS